MKKLFVLAAICLLASASQVSAQLIIRNNGHAEIGHDPTASLLPGQGPMYLNWIDTTTVFKVFGHLDEYASGARMTFGDNVPQSRLNVTIGELGNTDTDCLWMQGKHGAYLTSGIGAVDTIMYFDSRRSDDVVTFRKDLDVKGVFVQSDERFKENIEPVSDVLSSLENLEAVSYTLKNDDAKRCRAAINDMQIVTEKDQRDKDFFDQFYAEREQGDERYGFLAQNVKEVFPQLVYTDKSGYMYVDYIGLIPILVQSINELKAELAAVKVEKQDEESTQPMLQAAPQQAAQNEIEASLGAAKLYQNAPNPWSSETVIRYNLPQNVATACIYIYDMQGLQLKSIPAEGRGESRVVLTARDLKAGMYLYALVADGQLIDSKQMILTK